MSLLFMALGIAYGCVAFVIFVVCLFPTQHAQRDKWLATLTKEERAAYWHHEKRKKQYVKMRKRQSDICQALLQKAYNEDREMAWGEAWNEAAGIVNINQFNDVMLADDCPPAPYGHETPYRWKEKMPRPPGTTDAWRAGLRRQ